MPVVIRELVISATVLTGDGRDAGTGALSQGELDRERIVEECVAQVMDILERKRDR